MSLLVRSLLCQRGLRFGLINPVAAQMVTTKNLHCQISTKTAYLASSVLQSVALPAKSIALNNKAVAKAVLFGVGAFALAVVVNDNREAQKMELDEMVLKLKQVRGRWALACNHFHSQINNEGSESETIVRKAHRDFDEASASWKNLIHQVACQILQNDLFFERTSNGKRLPISETSNQKKWLAISQIIVALNDFQARYTFKEEKQLMEYIKSYRAQSGK